MSLGIAESAELREGRECVDWVAVDGGEVVDRLLIKKFRKRSDHNVLLLLGELNAGGNVTT